MHGSPAQAQCDTVAKRIIPEVVQQQATYYRKYNNNRPSVNSSSNDLGELQQLIHEPKHEPHALDLDDGRFSRWSRFDKAKHVEKDEALSQPYQQDKLLADRTNDYG